MKKSFLSAFALVCALFLSNTANAQFDKGTILINPGISFLGYSYGYSYYGGGYSGLPALSVSVEYSVTDNIGVGGYLGYQSRSYKYGGTYNDRLTSIGFGVRGVYHASSFLNDALSANINAEKLDIYAGLSLGYQTSSWKYDDSFNGIGRTTYSSGIPVFGGILGVRYMFKPSIGVYGELGRGAFGAITAGVTFKL